MSTVDNEMHVEPYGSWASPLTADAVARGAIGFGQLWYDGQRIFFTEMRPSEGGRSVLVQRDSGGRVADRTPPGFNVRTRVHEYGGGDYLVAGDTIYFSNFADQRVYRQDPDSPPRPITGTAALRFADYRLDAPRRRIVCVREDKRYVASREDINTLVALDLDHDEEGGKVLVSGSDFYAAPRPSPDGSRLCWLRWNHPDMPWDSAELWSGRFAPDGSIIDATHIAGGRGESVFQPEWGPDGDLYFVSDRTGFWNLYRQRAGTIESLCDKAVEFGAPQWAFGMATYGFIAPTLLLCAYTEHGVWRLATLDTVTRELVAVDTPYTWISSLRAAPGSAVFLAGSPVSPSAAVRFDAGSRKLEVLRSSTELTFDASYISVPEAIEFPTGHGTTAHGFFYRPQNPGFRAPSGNKPPLLVRCHGGPTGAASSLLSLVIQYWTSRGFALLDLNYGGSSGYGRAYRDRLNGNWGIVDVEDSVSGAQYLAGRNDVDPERLAIVGGSAGGFTVLAALTTRNVFKAGASHFGISDLERLAEDGRAGYHKFESRYEEKLIAPYPARADVYRARSPIHHADKLSCPVIFFQGLDDRIVLPNQAERMVEVLRQKRLPVAYLSFPGEGHGFRRAETIRRVLEAELYFYSRVFRFRLADKIDPIAIANLDAS